jgi:hypothetical protein
MPSVRIGVVEAVCAREYAFFWRRLSKCLATIDRARPGERLSPIVRATIGLVA